MFPLLLFSLFAFGARAVKRFGNIKEFVEATHKKRRLESTSASSSFAPALQQETLNTVLTDTLLSNKLSAKDVSRIARSAKAGGNFEDGVTSMAKAGNWGKAPKNLARDLLRAALRGVDMPPLFWWKIPTWDKEAHAQVWADYPFLLPHEMLSRVVSSGDISKFIVDGSDYPELFLRISAACHQLQLDQNTLIALGLHGDGVPFTKTDSMEIISWNFLALPTADRIPITSVSKKFLCQCGCKGQCAWQEVFRVIKWSLLMLFVGRISAFLPDGSPWDDRARANSSWKPLAQLSFRALLLQVRGDWPFLRTLFRFPSWKSKIICWLCRAGPHGSAVPFTDCGLSCLWRQMRITCHEFLAMLRSQGFDLNPLLSLPGFTTACVVLDWLHIVDLGVGADVLGCFFWELITTPGFLNGATKAARLGDLWQRLKEYYRREKPPCVLDNLTETMIKKDAAGSKPKLRAKGAECRYLIHFGVVLSQEFAAANEHVRSVAELFSLLYQLQELISVKPYNAEFAVELSRKFSILYCALGKEAASNNKPLLWQPKPKLHLFQEMIEFLAPDHGSPRHFWCYRDESWCGFWARASRRRGGANTVDTTAERFLNRYRALNEDAF